MSEMLPCPFCGSENLMLRHDDAGDYRTQWEAWVECCACDARSAQIVYRQQEESYVDTQAIAAWNSRTPPKPI